LQDLKSVDNQKATKLIERIPTSDLCKERSIQLCRGNLECPLINEYSTV